jgi:hypothetical protein
MRLIPLLFLRGKKQDRERTEGGVGGNEEGRVKYLVKL